MRSHRKSKIYNGNVGKNTKDILQRAKVKKRPIDLVLNDLKESFSSDGNESTSTNDEELYPDKSKRLKDAKKALLSLDSDVMHALEEHSSTSSDEEASFKI